MLLQRELWHKVTDSDEVDQSHKQPGKRGSLSDIKATKELRLLCTRLSALPLLQSDNNDIHYFVQWQMGLVKKNEFVKKEVPFAEISYAGPSARQSDDFSPYFGKFSFVPPPGHSSYP